MKVAVYLEQTLELIGVVDVDPSQLQMLREQRAIRIAKAPPLPNYALRPGDLIDSTFTIEQVEFRYFPLRNAHGAETICLTVRKKDWLSAWPKRLWPRRRAQRFRMKPDVWHKRAPLGKRSGISTPRHPVDHVALQVGPSWLKVDGA